MKELLIRILYVEMLGHDASFGYIKAVEFTASTNLLQKRVGYLTASLTLSPEHEFRFMLINQLQRVCPLVLKCQLIPFFLSSFSLFQGP
jgi:AP-4 complex subunit epsilon-1